MYESWFASIYDAITAPARRLRRRVARLARIGPGMRVVDIATGTGAQARAFAENGARVVGIVDYGRPRPRAWALAIQHVIAVFERDPYREFLRSDLQDLLACSGIAVVEEHRGFLGAARIVIARRGA